MNPCLFLLALLLACSSCEDWGAPTDPPRPFDAKVWSEVVAAELRYGLPQPRYAMLGDLRANHLKRGMTRAEVVALLGPPDRPSGVALVDAYLVGCSVSDPITLDCEYDAAGRLTGTWIVEH